MLTKDGTIYRDELGPWSEACGYRDYCLIVEINRGRTIERFELRFSKEDALTIASRILEQNDLAWSNARPCDAEPGEQRPAWIMPFPTRQPLRIEKTPQE